MGSDLLHVVYAVPIVVALLILDASVVASMYSFDDRSPGWRNLLKRRNPASLLGGCPIIVTRGTSEQHPVAWSCEVMELRSTTDTTRPCITNERTDMAKSNTIITMRGTPKSVEGNSVVEGAALPAFTLSGVDLADVTNASFAGKVLVLVVIPSIDTPVCAVETKRFNQEASALSEDVVIASVSRDLPFALKRWCAAEGVSRVVSLSDYKHRTFGKAFGVELPELGILARAVFVADKHGKVVHVDYVTEIAEEPDYAAALNAVKNCL